MFLLSNYRGGQKGLCSCKAGILQNRPKAEEDMRKEGLGTLMARDGEVKARRGEKKGL